MNERHLLAEISRRVSEAVSFAEALESIETLLEEKIGRAILLVRFPKTSGAHLREKARREMLWSVPPLMRRRNSELSWRGRIARCLRTTRRRK